jgi:MYXO-CTERM domain-containing protein
MSRPPLALASAPLALATLFLCGSARATYSIVATDSSTGQVGGAVTSCVAPSGVDTVYGSAPGHGGINAQAASYIAGRNEGVRLLNLGTDPAEIIRQITSPSIDPTSGNARQYGIADLSGRAAGFTGPGAMNYKEDRHGTSGSYTYSVQGNILTSKAVIDQTIAGFTGGGCDLAERMMRALEAGAQNGEGDSRCTSRNPSIPSNSASIQVDPTGAAPRSYLFLTVAGPTNMNPLPRLRTMFDAWRMTHPCATGDGGVNLDAGAPRDASADARDARAPDAASDARDTGGGGNAGAGGSGATGGAGAGGTASGGAGGSGGDSGAGGASGAGTATGSGTTTGSGTSSAATTSGAGTTSGTGGGSAAGSTTGGSGPGSEDAGCSCRVGGRSNGWTGAAWVAALALGTMLRRAPRMRKRRDASARVPPASAQRT